jgi:two-component SAPR family response regulator
VEVLTYLLDHPDVHLEQVLLDLFGESSARQGRNYFHQVRYELARKVPGLSVPFDAVRKTYRVYLDGVDVDSDFDTVRRALVTGGEQGLEQALRLFAGPLLPHAESEWAIAEREDLSAALVRLGVTVLEGWSASGRYHESRDLAERLLTVDPWNELVTEYVVRATRAAEGEVAAVFMADRYTRRFERELGLVPRRLMSLRRPG